MVITRVFLFLVFFAFLSVFEDCLELEAPKGIKINPFKDLVNKYEYFFGEDQARYIIEIPKTSLKKVNEILNKYSVHFDEFGTVNGQSIAYKDDINLSIEELTDVHKYWLKKYMDS